MSDSAIRYNLDPDHQLTGEEKRMLDEAEASVSRASGSGDAAGITVTLSPEAMEEAERLGGEAALSAILEGVLRDPEAAKRAPGRLTAAGGFLLSFHSRRKIYFPSSSTVRSIPAIISVLIALSTQRIMTPTSAKMANHMLAMPIAPRIRHRTLMKMAKTMFS